MCILTSSRSRSAKRGRCTRRAGCHRRPRGLRTLVDSLDRTDRVALEVTGSSREIARLTRAPREQDHRRLSRAIPASVKRARRPTGSTRARWPSCLWTGELEAVWMPPEWIARMRRRLARREQLVRARSRVKNEIHAVLMRCLKGRPPVSDLFGVKGRHWLRGLELPTRGSETVKAGLRHIEFLDHRDRAGRAADRHGGA